MMWGYGDSWGWGGWMMMAVMMVLFWGVVIAAIVAAVRYFGGNRTATTGSGPTITGSAERLLAERFARGEIDEDEYRARLSLLREHR
ncbi:SHOCT domain-containing protein [Nocardia arthritidis]